MNTNPARSRRHFIGVAGMGIAGAAVIPSVVGASVTSHDRKVRIGIVGGRFGLSFQFHNHPDCTVEAVSDLIPGRREKLMSTYKCQKSYPSLEQLLKDRDVDAVFIATGAPDHARHVIASLKAGKHVLCAVPAAMNLDECNEILETVKRTGLIYMMAETSIWRQSMISAKKFYSEGAFGNLMKAVAQYHHPGLESLYVENGQKT